MIEIIVRFVPGTAALEFFVSDGFATRAVHFRDLESTVAAYRVLPTIVRGAIDDALEHFARSAYERAVLNNEVETPC